MSLSKQSVVNQIEITQDNALQVRFGKQIVDGNTVLSNEWHRTIFAPGSDIDSIMSAVNADLLSMGYPEVSTGDVDKIKAHAHVAWGE